MDANLKAGTYFILQSRMECLNCDGVTAVLALGLPAGYSQLKKTRGAMEWTIRKVSALLADVEYLLPTVALRAQGLTPHYRLDRARRAPRTTWINHCEHCGYLLADYAVHDMREGEGPFDLSSDPTIQVHEVLEPFEGCAIESCENPAVLRERQ